VKCRQFLEECSLDTSASTAMSFSKITPVRAVETLLNLYLLHLESNEITGVITGIVDYSLKVFTRADRGSRDDNTDDDTSDNAIVDLSTWNMKSTFIVYFRCLFKHFIIKARSVRLPNESKKKTELENTCAEWLELNELFRKFVSFVTIDQIYSKNVMVSNQYIQKDLPKWIYTCANLGNIHCSSLLETVHRCLSSACHAYIGSLLPTRYTWHETAAHGPTEIHSTAPVAL
jgi:hypothetical protein